MQILSSQIIRLFVNEDCKKPSASFDLVRAIGFLVLSYDPMLLNVQVFCIFEKSGFLSLIIEYKSSNCSFFLSILRVYLAIKQTIFTTFYVIFAIE